CLHTTRRGFSAVCARSRRVRDPPGTACAETSVVDEMTRKFVIFRSFGELARPIWGRERAQMLEKLRRVGDGHARSR
ncbi:hypothetical protein, partial [Mycolicibacterium phlei]